MTDYPCGTGPGVPTEMQLFFRHREASLALSDVMGMLVAEDPKPVLAKMLDAVVVRRSPDKSAFGLGYLTGLLTSYIASWIPTNDGFGVPGKDPGELWAQIEVWYAEVGREEIMFVLGSAGIEAGNKSADHAQNHAISLERQA